MSLNEMVISQSSAKGPCRTYNENIRLHTERTPCRVEDQWSGLMKGGWCSWWLKRKKKGQKSRDLWCWLSNILSTVPVFWLSRSVRSHAGLCKKRICCCISRLKQASIITLCFLSKLTESRSFWFPYQTVIQWYEYYSGMKKFNHFSWFSFINPWLFSNIS